jgi:hypothetical protein
MAAVVLMSIAFSVAAGAAPAYVVTTGADSGPGSLRDALGSGATKIEIDPSVAGIAIVSSLVYTGDAALAIHGAGQTVSADGDYTLLELTSGADLTISELDFAGIGGFSLNNPGTGKGIFVDVPLNRQGIVSLKLTDVAVSGVAYHGIHVSDCTLVPCGGGGGGAGDGSEASVHVALTQVTVDDAGNGGFDSDGVRIDERFEGDIVFAAVASTFNGVGADGVELDEGGDGDVVLAVRNSAFTTNGAYCLDATDPIDPCFDDDGFGNPDLDDGFDVDEAGEGSVIGWVKNVWVGDNLDEGLDFDEEGGGGFDLTLADVHVWDNGDEGIKASEEDAGDAIVRLRSSTAGDNGDDGVQIEEEDDGDVVVTVNSTTTIGHDANGKVGLNVSQSDAGTGTLKVRGSDFSDGIDTDGVTEL